MNGDTKIPSVNTVILFKKQGERFVNKLNRNWTIKLPDDRLGTATVDGSDDSVVINLEQLGVVELIACDEDGNQSTYLLLGVNITPFLGA